MQPSALVRLLMSQDRVNELGKKLGRELAVSGVMPSPVPVGRAAGAPIAGSKVAELQEEMDREARTSLVISWLGLLDSPDEWG